MQKKKKAKGDFNLCSCGRLFIFLISAVHVEALVSFVVLRHLFFFLSMADLSIQTLRWCTTPFVFFSFLTVVS